MFEHIGAWAELGYARSFTERFSGNFRIYCDHFGQDTENELFPEGFPGYPDGALSSADLGNRTYGSEMQFDMDLSEENHLIFGANFEHTKQYDVEHSTNFDPWTFQPLDSFQDVSSWGNFNKDVTREIWAVYIQDEWAATDSLTLTAGVRYDHYDDFGGTTNPRIGIVWNLLKGTDLKLLYGQAFRSPNFVELYNDGNPSVLGDPELKPEKIKTYEASLGYRFGNSYEIIANYFYNDIEDLIGRNTSASPVRYANTGGAKTDGVEISMSGKYGTLNYWRATYTWQDPRDADTDERLAYVPSQRATFSANYEVCEYLSAHADILWTDSRPRASGDIRSDVSSHTIVDIALIARNFWKNLEIQGTIHNLFDEEYEDPDTSGASRFIPGDFPRPGMSALVEFRYRF